MKMKKNQSLVIIAILTVIGLGFASCDPNANGEQMPSDIYIVTSALNGYSAAGRELPRTTYTTVQEAINAIRDDAGGEDCTIQFGNGSDILDIGTAFVSFSENWGLITLTGKITSANTFGAEGTILLEGSANIESKADITNTSTSVNARAINNRGTGTVTVSEGTVSVDTGVALFNNSTGKIAVTGGNVTSRNSTTGSGTIHIAGSGTITNTRLEITGGKIGNTSISDIGGNTIRNFSSGAVKISGGAISATAANGFAIYSTHSNGQLIMSGSPDINQKIQTPYERIIVETPFEPVQTISLNFNMIAKNAVAVKNGKDFLDCFVLFNQPYYKLIEEENDLIIDVLNDYFSYTKEENVYLISRNTNSINYSTVQEAINAIRVDANGANCTIQFGNGINTLNMEQESVTFSGNWGFITLTGNLTSANANVNEGTIVLRENVSIISNAYIANTANTTEAKTINNGLMDSAGNVTVRSGIISAASGTAIYNRSGKITIEGGTVTSQNWQPSTGGTVVIVNTGSSPGIVLEVLGGTISNTSTNQNCNAIRNRSKGTVKIGGGFISATATGFSISSDIAESQLFLSGNPDITHRIRVPYGVLGILDQFNPVRTYTLDFNEMTVGSIAVKDGANFISNFTLHQQQNFSLIVSDDDLVINGN